LRTQDKFGTLLMTTMIIYIRESNLLAVLGRADASKEPGSSLTHFTRMQARASARSFSVGEEQEEGAIGSSARGAS
jgi:hypothetical protein